MTNKPPAGLTETDYEAIEAAVMETARGRWFLIEYDRRRRAAETTQLLQAVTRLERALGHAGPAALGAPPKLAALSAPLTPSSSPPGASTISERLQDVAWSMRERGFDDAICGAIEEQARLVRELAEAGAGHSGFATPAAPDPRIDALAGIDRMPLAEKLALFI